MWWRAWTTSWLVLWATSWESSRVREASPLRAIDPGLWPDHVAQVLVALDTAATPWRVVAADRLRGAADLIGRQTLPRSAFSFAGNAAARSYDTLHQMTVCLLLDGTRTFTDAATSPSAEASIHDTAETAQQAGGDGARGHIAGPSHRAAAPAGEFGATGSAAMSELSESLRSGLDRCSRHVQAVTTGVEAVLARLPAGTDVGVYDDLAALRRQFDRAREGLQGVLAPPGIPTSFARPHSTGHERSMSRSPPWPGSLYQSPAETIR